MTETEYWFWLCNIPGMWQGKIKKLLKVFRTPEELYRASEGSVRSTLEKESRWKKEDIDQIVSCPRGNEEEQLEKLYKKGIHFIHIGMDQYPDRLRNLYDPPYSLYVRGNLPKEDVPTAAIVGARSCTPYGREMTKRLAKSLSAYGIQTVSGLARGIDSCCHTGTLDGGGKTFAILGSGIDVCYPPENLWLYQECSQNGGVISEYPPGTAPLGWQFPHRNRIISGLADKLIVMEAREKSGSLLTVESALEQGKDVFALPGRVTDPCSKGCNLLLRQGAIPITDTEDLLEEYHLTGKSAASEDQTRKSPLITLSREENLVDQCLNMDHKGIQQLIDETGLEPKAVIAALFSLQSKKLVQEEAGRYYKIP